MFSGSVNAKDPINLANVHLAIPAGPWHCFSMTALVNADGQLTLPPEVCQRLGLKPGEALELQTEGSLLLAWKQSADDPFAKWRGRGQVPSGNSTDQYLQLTRDGDGS